MDIFYMIKQTLFVNEATFTYKTLFHHFMDLWFLVTYQQSTLIKALMRCYVYQL